MVLECHQERKKKANNERQTELARRKKIDIVWCAFERTKKIRRVFLVVTCHTPKEKKLRVSLRRDF